METPKRANIMETPKRANKPELIRTLRERGIWYPPSATVPQLRQILNDAMELEELRNRPNTSGYIPPTNVTAAGDNRDVDTASISAAPINIPTSIEAAPMEVGTPTNIAPAISAVDENISPAVPVSVPPTAPIEYAVIEHVAAGNQLSNQSPLNNTPLSAVNMPYIGTSVANRNRLMDHIVGLDGDLYYLSPNRSQPLPIYTTATRSNLNAAASIFTMAAGAESQPSVSAIHTAPLSTNPSPITADAAMDQELETLRKRKELLELRRQVEILERGDAISNNVVTGASALPTMTILDVGRVIPAFDGSRQSTYDVHKFIADLEALFDTIRSENTFRYMCLRSRLTGAAADFLTGSTALAYDDLKRELTQEFGQMLSTTELIEQLRYRRWDREAETMHHYVLKMQGTARRGNLPEHELVGIIVDGLRLPLADANLLVGNAPTINELKKALNRHESRLLNNIRTVARNRTVAPTPAAVRSTGGPSRDAPRSTMNRAPSRDENRAPSRDENRCRNCRQRGHRIADCTLPQRPDQACFRCWKTGHAYKDCRSPTSFVHTYRTTAAAVQPDDVMDHEDEAANIADDEIAPVNLVSVTFESGQTKLIKNKILNIVSLFDTGSEHNFIRCTAIPFGIKHHAYRLPLKGLGNRPLIAYGYIDCTIKFRNINEIIRLIVLPESDMGLPLILGRSFLRTFNIGLCQINKNVTKLLKNKPFTNVKNNTPICFPKSTLARLPHVNFNLGNTEVATTVHDKINSELINTKMVCEVTTGKLNVMKPSEHKKDSVPIVLPSASHQQIEYLPSMYECPVFTQPEIIELDNEEAPTPIPININSNLPLDTQNTLHEIIRRYYLEPEGIEVKPHEYEMNIRLTNDTPIHALPRRLSYYEREQVQRILDRLLDKSIIRPSDSPYASAIVLVKKKDGEPRMCTDFRDINRVTARDNFPLPLIEDCIGYLSGKKYFTTLDLRDGFFHVSVAPDSVKYTSFVVPQGQYEYLKMPFGLKNAPAVFQRFVSEIFADLIKAGKIQVYIDDIIIATETIEEHDYILGQVLQRLTEKQLELKLSKCRFAYERIDYLGYVVTAEGIRPNDDHINAVKQLKLPKNAKDLQQNLGLFSYFRMFIKSFSTIAKPLRLLTQPNATFDFDENCRLAFDTLKEKLIHGPVLAIYAPGKETELHCDASSLGFGATLMQRQADKKFHPTAFFSQATTPPESRYHSFELETLAIIYALRRFRVYLEGIKFTIVTDCSSLKLTLEKKHMNPRIARWALELQPYDYTVQHRAGVRMGHVDALSRCHEPHPKTEDIVNAVLVDTDAEQIKCRLIATVDDNELSFRLQIAQYRDEKIVALRSKLEQHAVAGYTMTNGLIFKQSSNNVPKLYVPQEMEENIIRVSHEKVAHLGVEKTFEFISRHYWFPTMRSKIEQHIKNCIPCIVYAAPVRASERNLYSIKKEPIPFDTIHIDHFGPLPSINSKRKYLLVVVDGFTKHCKLYAVNSTSTREVIAVLEKYFDYYSRPRRIISDQGTCFTALEFAEKLKKWNIEHVKIAVASPQANGQVERVNRTVKAMLGKLTEPINHADWVQKLNHIEYALNNTKHSTTGFSACELLFGVNQRGKIPDELSEYITAEYHETPVRDLETIRASASESIVKTQAYSEARQIEKSTPVREYKKGDFVVMRNVDVTVGTNKKLIPLYRGPYTIHKVMPNDRYVIRDIENCQLTQRPYNNIIEAARLRPWAEKKRPPA